MPILPQSKSITGEHPNFLDLTLPEIKNAGVAIYFIQYDEMQVKCHLGNTVVLST